MTKSQKYACMHDAGVPCPICGSTMSYVLDSRRRRLSQADLTTVKRRRECGGCGVRYNTHEIPEQLFEEIDKEIRQSVAESVPAATKKRPSSSAEHLNETERE